MSQNTKNVEYRCFYNENMDYYKPSSEYMYPHASLCQKSLQSLFTHHACGNISMCFSGHDGNHKETHRLLRALRLESAQCSSIILFQDVHYPDDQ